MTSRWWLYVHDVDENGNTLTRRLLARGWMPHVGETFRLVLSGVCSTVQVTNEEPAKTTIITNDHASYDHDQELCVIGQLPKCHVQVLKVEK